MYPVLFRVGGFEVHAYGFFVTLALVAAGLVAARRLRRLGFEPGFAVELTVAAVLGGFAGARLYWIAEHWSDVRLDPLHHALGGAGFTWYGGVLGGTAAVVGLALVKRMPLGTVANVVAPSLALGYAMGRIACQFAGDGTYGRPSGLPWAMAYPNGAVPTWVPVQPTPVYETLTMLVVFVALYRMARRPQPGWYVFAWFLVLSGLERFLVEFLRINAFSLAGLTPPQWFALGSIALGVIVLALLHRVRFELRAVSR